MCCHGGVASQLAHRLVIACVPNVARIHNPSKKSEVRFVSTPRSSSISPAKLALPIITLVLALVAAVVGYVQTTTGLADLSKALESQTATATDVYGGQSAIGVASAILSAGIIGVVISLAAIGILIGLNGFRRDVVVEDVILDEEFLDDDVDGIDELQLDQAAAPAAPAAPAAAAPAAPVHAEPAIVTEPAAAPAKPAEPAAAPAEPAEPEAPAAR